MILYNSSLDGVSALRTKAEKMNVAVNVIMNFFIILFKKKIFIFQAKNIYIDSLKIIFYEYFS